MEVGTSDSLDASDFVVAFPLSFALLFGEEVSEVTGPSRFLEIAVAAALTSCPIRAAIGFDCESVPETASSPISDLPFVSDPVVASDFGVWRDQNAQLPEVAFSGF